MQIRAFIPILRRCAELAESARNFQLSEDVLGLISILEISKSGTVSSFISRLEKGREASESVQMAPRTVCLLNFLDQLKTLFLELKKAPIAKDIEKLEEVLKFCDKPTIREFHDDAKIWFENAAPKPKKSPPPLDKEVAREYADQLTTATDSNEKFDPLIAILRKDKAVRIGEMREIASRYLGYEIGKISKKDALLKIVEHQALLARHETKGKAIRQMSGW